MVLINIEQAVLRTLNKMVIEGMLDKQQIAHLRRKNGKEKIKRKGFGADNKWIHCLEQGTRRRPIFYIAGNE